MNHESPAFPVVHPDGLGAQYFGMSLLDFFAAAALQGMLAREDFDRDKGWAARLAYLYAQEMVSHRSK